MRLRILLTALLALTASTAVADPAPTLLPTITNSLAGVMTPEGTYRWEWSVFGGQKPSLSHFVLIDICANVKADIVPDSFYGAPHEIGSDPTTGYTGIKFEAELDDNEVELFGFETFQEWAPGTLDVAFKSGQNVTLQTDVLGPGCELANPYPPTTPEPASLALLGLGAAGIARQRLRRRKSVE